MVILQLVTASAQYASVPQEMLYFDELTPFQGIGVDTGYLPDPNDPISVRFHITPSGGIFTEMEALSDLRWPTAFNHSTLAIPGEGEFGIDVDLDIEFEVKIDIGGVYQDTIPVWTENFGVTRTTDFDTLVLPGSPETPLGVSAQGNLLDPFEYDIGIITGVGLEFAVDIEPEVTAQLEGNHVETELSGVIGMQDEENGTAQLTGPVGSPGQALLLSTYVADLTSLVTLNIVPSATLDTFLGDFELVAFDFPVVLLDLSEERRFDTVAVTHPLPAMDPISIDDFGQVEVGSLANHNLPLINLGVLGLEGIARIEGNQAFTVFPDYFYASEAQSDGLVVTFAPAAVGGAGATLVIESNDPSTPELRIPLSGTGFEDVPTPPPTPPPTPDVVPTPDPDGISGEEVKGCGCNSSVPTWPVALVWIGLFGIRRRC